MGLISESVQRYLASCEAQGMSPKTILTYRTVLEGVFLEWCAEVGVETTEELDQDAAETYQRWVFQRPDKKAAARGIVKATSRHTQHRYIRVFRQLANYANIDARPKPPRLGKVRKPVLSREEQDRLENSCRGSQRNRLMIVLMGRRALRGGEVLLLEDDDLVKLGRRHFVHVRGKGAGGNNEERWVPIKPALYRELQAWVENKPDDAPAQIFYSVNRPFRALTVSGVHQMVKVAGLEARIKRSVNPHLLRHSVITYWRLERGLDVARIKGIAGNFYAIDEYTHFEPGRDYGFYDDLD